MKSNQILMSGTELDVELDILTQIEESFKEEESKKIVLYNDDINSFDHVIRCLVKYCGHDKLQAEQCAMIVHSKGKCSVKEGDYDKLKPIKEALCENYLDAKIE